MIVLNENTFKNLKIVPDSGSSLSFYYLFSPLTWGVLPYLRALLRYKLNFLSDRVIVIELELCVRNL